MIADRGVGEDEANVTKIRRMSGTRRKEYLREVGFFALCFLAPVLLMALIWGNVGISYGGKVTPLTYDMKAQYMPFYASLRYILSGEN
ncbi:MAG: YfhO family protein, partial [Lachnoclostridium sp.]|nr:YfhO family protein [Lachnoclostridium sp.]MCM1383696.1 YfhO family protein [Lachnoclostridium sp.]